MVADGGGASGKVVVDILGREEVLLELLIHQEMVNHTQLVDRSVTVLISIVPIGEAFVLYSYGEAQVIKLASSPSNSSCVEKRRAPEDGHRVGDGNVSVDVGELGVKVVHITQYHDTFSTAGSLADQISYHLSLGFAFEATFLVVRSGEEMQPVEVQDRAVGDVEPSMIVLGHSSLSIDDGERRTGAIPNRVSHLVGCSGERSDWINACE